MKTLRDLITAIRTEFADYKSITECNVDKLQSLMQEYQSNSSDWEQFAFFDPNKYTRNLIDDGNGNYNLIVLCWGQGQKSPIHDHANAHCIFKVLDGELLETRYEWPRDANEMQETTADLYHKNQVNYMHDKIGLHRVSNNSSKPAISLHLYSPPILECQTFVQETGQARASGTCCFYSKYGKLCHIASQICDKIDAQRSGSLTEIKKFMGLDTLVPPNPSYFKLGQRQQVTSDVTVIEDDSVLEPEKLVNVIQ